MHILYQNDLPEKDQYFNLFLTTGWYLEHHLTNDQLYEAIQYSWYLISAYDNNKLVGFGRIISDGILHALIVDLIVLPAYRKKGIGSKILTLLVERCKAFHICDIQLFCAKGKVDFYKKHGFDERPADAPGMQFHKCV